MFFTKILLFLLVFEANQYVIEILSRFSCQENKFIIPFILLICLQNEIEVDIIIIIIRPITT